MFQVLIAEKVECVSQGPAPLLIPAGSATSLAATVSYPTPDAVNTAPRRSFTVWPAVDLNFEVRRMFVEIFPVVRDCESAHWRFLRERVRQTKSAKLEVMAVGLAVSGEIDHLAA